MADAKTTPEVEVKKLNADGTPASEPTNDKKEGEEKEPKVGDLIDDEKGDDKKPKGDEDKPQTVGLDKFLEEKKARKAAEKRIAKLEAQLGDGEEIDAEEISDEIDSLAEEFEVSKPFLKKLEKTLLKKIGKEADDKVSSRLDGIEEEKRAEAVDKAFTKHFNIAMEKMSEFKDIVNPEVIKTLSLDPKNKDKTFSQIIEDTYGKSLPGRKTIEKTTPGGGKDPEEVDFDRAVRDTKYYTEIMANPAMKKKYNDGIEKRLRL